MALVVRIQYRMRIKMGHNIMVLVDNRAVYMVNRQLELLATLLEVEGSIMVYTRKDNTLKIISKYISSNSRFINITIDSIQNEHVILVLLNSYLLHFFHFLSSLLHQLIFFIFLMELYDNEHWELIILHEVHLILKHYN